MGMRSVTAIMGTVIGLTFLFGFGNVLALGLRLGVPAYVAPAGRAGAVDPVLAEDLPHRLHPGLQRDRALTLPHHNSGTEGVNTRPS